MVPGGLRALGGVRRGAAWEADHRAQAPCSWAEEDPGDARAAVEAPVEAVDAWVAVVLQCQTGKVSSSTRSSDRARDVRDRDCEEVTLNTQTYRTDNTQDFFFFCFRD